MNRFYIMLMLFTAIAACKESNSGEIEAPSRVKPSSIEEAAMLMSADRDYKEYVETEKKLKYMLAALKVNMGKVRERMNEPGKSDLCLWSKTDVEDVEGAYEYAQLLCKKISLVRSLYEKFPFLEDMGSKDLQYLFSRNTRVFVTPEEVLVSMKK